MITGHRPDVDLFIIHYFRLVHILPPCGISSFLSFSKNTKSVDTLIRPHRYAKTKNPGREDSLVSTILLHSLLLVLQQVMLLDTPSVKTEP